MGSKAFTRRPRGQAMLPNAARRWFKSQKIRCAARADDGQSFWEGPETRRAAKRKQRSAVPPGRPPRRATSLSRPRETAAEREVSKLRPDGEPGNERAEVQEGSAVIPRPRVGNTQTVASGRPDGESAKGKWSGSQAGKVACVQGGRSYWAGRTRSRRQQGATSLPSQQH